MRSRKALANTMAGFVYEITSIICGLILPRLILSHFGSAYNGITTSISQFLSGVELLKAGIGAVTQAALYKPLADGNVLEISSIVKTTERFMRRIALIFIGLVLAFACIYPIWVNEEFDWLFSFTLILIISISTFAQYFFGVTYQMLFKADQRQCVINFVQIGTMILNTVIASALILSGCKSIHVIKLASAIVFLLNPLIINLYAKKKYNLTKKVEYNDKLISQRWDAFAQELALFVHNNTDIVVLTVFADLFSVSIYTVYYYVTKALHSVVNIFINSFSSAFGNMFAKGEHETAEKNLRVMEMIVFTIVTILYSVAGIMIVPYAMLFTKGVTDAEYNQPIFATFLVLAGAFACFRIPYNTIIRAAGHFKQTRNYAIIEAAINIVVSVVFVITVKEHQLVGVAVGTLVATVYRTFISSYYISKHIIKRNQLLALKHVLVALVTAGITVAIAELFIMPVFYKSTAFNWFLFGAIFTVMSTAVTFATNMIFYRKDFMLTVKKIKVMLTKRSKAK